MLETKKAVNKAIEHFSVTIGFRIQLGIDGFEQKLFIDKIAPFLFGAFITHQLPDGRLVLVIECQIIRGHSLPIDELGVSASHF